MENLNFFAGLESLMEDPEVQEASNPIEQGEPVENVVQDTVERAEEVAEIATAEMQLDRWYNTGTLLLGRLNEIDRMCAYVQQNGVDRSFLSLCNYKDVLNRTFDLKLPATESFNEEPSPSSAVSQAAMEGFTDAVKGVWDWIWGILKKIGGFFADTWKKFLGLFSSSEKKAEEAVAQANKDPNAKIEIDEAEVKKYLGLLQKRGESTNNPKIKEHIASLSKKLDELLKAEGDAKKKALTDFFTELRTYGKEIREEAKQAQAKAQEAQQQAKAAQQQTKEAAQPEQQKEVVAKAKTETQQALNIAKGTKDDSNLLVRGFNFISKMVKTGAAKAKSVMGVIKQVFSKTKDQYSSPQAAEWARKYIEFKTTGKGERVDDNLKIWNDNDKRLILESIKQIEVESAKVANSIDENAEGKYNI